MVKHFYVGKVPDAEITKIPSDAFDLYDKTKYGIVNFTGLDRPGADISRSALAGANASRISGSQISERNIVLTIRPWISAEINRQELYDHLPYDTDLRFYIVTENRCVFIDGRVEKLGGGGFTKNVMDIQLSIICPFPWFQSVKLHTVSLVVGEKNTVRNDGDIPAGFWLEINNDDPEGATINNLSLSIDGESFGYTGSIVAPYICTIPGRKKLNGNGRDGSPAFGMMNRDSDWIALKHGENIITVSTTTAPQFEASNTLYFRDTYSGV